MDLEVVDGDVTRMEVDAIANAANTELAHGGGVAAAISRAGGPEVQRESDERAPISLGEAVETTAGAMPARWVIHAATMELGGPRRSSPPRRARRWPRRTSLAAARWRWSPSAPASGASTSSRQRG